MEKNEVNKALAEYYRLTIEHCEALGVGMRRSFTESIMSAGLFLTLLGLLISQKITLSFWMTIGMVIIGIVLFLFFIASVGEYFYLQIHLHNMFDLAVEIEDLQQDILFDKVRGGELEKRFEEVRPALKTSKFEIRWKGVFKRCGK